MVVVVDWTRLGRIGLDWIGLMRGCALDARCKMRAVRKKIRLG